MTTSPPSPVLTPARRAFTLVELLVTISIILVLIAILGIAVRGIGKSATTSQARTQLNLISQAIESFKKDFGYEPPLLSENRSGTAAGINPGGVQTPELQPTAPLVSAAYKEIRYSSQFSLAAFLLGVGNLNGIAGQPGGAVPNLEAVSDGNPNYKALASHDGVPGPGVRNPGRYKAWKQPTGPDQLAHSPEVTGRGYGPYLSMEQMGKYIQAVEVNRLPLRARLGTVDSSSNVFMYRFLDPAGNPIRYYRNWPTKDPNTGQASVARIPVEIRDLEAVKVDIAKGSASAPRPSDREVMTASYMLLSPVAPKSAPSGAISASTPYEDSFDQVFDKAMPFVGSTDPVFTPASLDQDAIRSILDFLTTSVRQGPQ